MIINSDGFGLFVFIEAWGEALGFISFPLVAILGFVQLYKNLIQRKNVNKKSIHYVFIDFSGKSRTR